MVQVVDALVSIVEGAVKSQVEKDNDSVTIAFPAFKTVVNPTSEYAVT